MCSRTLAVGHNICQSSCSHFIAAPPCHALAPILAEPIVIQSRICFRRPKLLPNSFPYPAPNPNPNIETSSVTPLVSTVVKRSRPVPGRNSVMPPPCMHRLVSTAITSVIQLILYPRKKLLLSHSILRAATPSSGSEHKRPCSLPRFWSGRNAQQSSTQRDSWNAPHELVDILLLIFLQKLRRRILILFHVDRSTDWPDKKNEMSIDRRTASCHIPTETIGCRNGCGK